MNGLITIFGARVMPDGTPSRSLRRRIDAATAAAGLQLSAPILCSGAAGGPHLPSEATVMRDILLKAGVAPERIILDEASRDTLQSAAAAARCARQLGNDTVLIASDRYHQPRIHVLIRLLGVNTQGLPIRSALKENGAATLLRMCLREIVAVPYDAALVIAQSRRLLNQTS